MSSILAKLFPLVNTINISYVSMNRNSIELRASVLMEQRVIMPYSLNYPAILPYVSNSRLNSYQNVFSHIDDAELYGIYIWSQQAAASIYPILQNFEVTLRNAVDREARKRFGDYWWDKIDSNDPTAKFYEKIKAAKGKLKSEWKRKTFGLPPGSSLPAGHSYPVWSHDEIVAATDCSAWEFILIDSFATTDRARQNDFLWPKSLGKVFKNHDIESSDRTIARQKIMSLVNEIRTYRNRLFHHEPLWTKAPHVTNDQTAIDTIRQKINRIEKLIKIIDLNKLAAMRKVGMFLHARRICSTQGLGSYTYKPCIDAPTRKQRRVIRKLLGLTKKGNHTATFEYANRTFAMHRLR